METCVIYSRVSTEEQAKEGRSIDDQISRLTEEAEKNKYQLMGVYKDPGFSGTNGNRPGLQEMLAFCQKNNIGKILVVDTDRIARKEELHFAIKALLRKCGTKIESLNQPMIDDSPEGSLLDTILAAVNSFQPRVTGRKTSMTMEEKAKSGWWPGWAPLGYLNQRNPSASTSTDKNIVVIDPIMGNLVAECFKRYASGGYTTDGLSEEMYNLGLRTRKGERVGGNDIASILGRTFYIGKLPYKGNVYQGNHEPLIDETTFMKCRSILAEHNRYADRKRKYNFLLNGFVHCGICGSALTAEHHLVKQKSYYHCAKRTLSHTNKGQNISVELLEKDVAQLFRHISLPQSAIDRIMLQARKILAETHDTIDEKRRLLEKNKSNLESKRHILESKLLEGVIDNDTYKRQHLVISADLGAIEADLAHLNFNRDENIALFEKLLLLARNVYKAYVSASPELKRRYLALFWEKIIVEDRQIKEAIPTKAFQAIMPEPSLTASILSSKVISFNKWLPRLDSNQ